MTKIEGRSPTAAVKELFSQSPDGLRKMVKTALQEAPEAEMSARVPRGQRRA